MSHKDVFICSAQDCHIGIDDWEVSLFEIRETHKQLKERYNFLATITHLISEKEQYLFKSHIIHNVFSIYLPPTTGFILKIILTVLFLMTSLFIY